jgi:hypothetical protein
MFGIFKTISDVRKGIHDPAGLGQELALDVVRAPIIIFTAIGILFLGLMFILGFTSVFNHPHVFFKVMFWILGIAFALIELVLWSLFGVFKRVVEAAKQKVKDSKIIDVTPR